jgi:hypothetical protein
MQYKGLISAGEIHPELWIPVGALPLWTCPSKSKMHLSFEDAPSIELEPRFRSLVKEFLQRYAPGRILIPSPFATMKVGGRKYNDGGEARKDCERPTISFNSGFKFQEFITKPLTPREVWLPGKSIKDDNGWWNSVVDSVLRKVDYYAGQLQADEIYNELKRRFDPLPFKRGWGAPKIYFDMSAYGLQYPRRYLAIIAEEIRELYDSCELLDEQLEILHSILE